MENEIRRSVILSAPIDRVWKAISDANEFAIWFRAKVSKPFEPGASIQCQSTYPGHEGDSWEMTIIEMTPPTRLSYQWPAYYGHDSDRDGTLDPLLTVTFDLEPCAEGTKLTVTETGFANLPADYAPTAFRDNDHGWKEQLQNIESYVRK